MKDIKAILAEHGEGLSDEAQKAIISAVGDNYRSIEEMTKKADRIKDLEETNNILTEQVNVLTEQVGALEGDSKELENLRDQVEQFKADEETRKAAEEEKAKRNAFMDTFNAAVGDNEFTNNLIKETVFEKVYAKCNEDATIGTEKALEDVVKDLNGVYVNPQNDPKRMPTSEQISTKKNTGEDAAKKTIAEFMFGKR